ENFDKYQAEGLTPEEMYSRAQVEEEGRKRTPKLTQSQAEIKDAFVEGMWEGLEGVGRKVGESIAEFFSERVKITLPFFEWGGTGNKYDFDPPKPTPTESENQ
ncbi:MAG: hypothetical protein WD512_01570, partial [Candidatus Paceibacterota bacterium]